MDIILPAILLLYQIFFSSQMKISVIIGNKHYIYKLPHEMRNDLTLKILGNYEIPGKFQKCIEL